MSAHLLLSLIPVDIRDSLFPTATHGTVRGSSLLHPVSLVRSYIGRIDLASYFSRLFEAILSPTLYDTGSLCARVKILCPLFVANYSGLSRGTISLYHDSHPAFPAMRPHSIIVRLSCVKTFFTCVFGLQWSCRKLHPDYNNPDYYNQVQTMVCRFY